MKDMLTESREWYNKKLAEKVIKQLDKNNMTGIYVETEEEAKETLLRLIPEGSKVGYGGSLTLQQIGALHALRTGNYEFIDRRNADEEEQYKLRKESLFADVFIMGTNAITLDGKLVNIDGFGNRVAALIFGPPKVIIVAGINKIVSDLNAAMYRIKNFTCPLHAKKGNRPLPCAETGMCIDCHAPKRFCNSIVIIEHQYKHNKDRITIIIVGKELGL